MTNPESTGSAHPARAAGFALIGVAAVALVIGVTSLFTGGDDAGAQQTGATQSGAQQTGEQPGGQTTTSQSGSDPAQPTTTAAPTTPVAPTTTAPPVATITVTPSPQATAKPSVRVYNNSTITDLAAKVSEDVRRAGWEVAGYGNYSEGQGRIPTTTVYFRPGTDEEASARQLAEALKAEAKPRFDGIQDAHPGIIVIATNDYQGPSGKF